MNRKTAVFSVSAILIASLTGCRPINPDHGADQPPSEEASLRANLPESKELPAPDFENLTIESQRKTSLLIGQTIVAKVSMIDVVERRGKVFLEGHIFPRQFVRLSITEDLFTQIRNSIERFGSCAVAFRLLDVRAPSITFRRADSRISLKVGLI